jgi:hypothetical protein
MENINRKLTFSPPIDEFIAGRKDAYYTTFSGGNNSGKSLVLKNMRTSLGRRAYMAGPQRFYHVTEIATQRFNKSDYDSWNNDFITQSRNEEHNYEHNFIDLGRIIGGLKDTKRNQLLELCGRMIGNNFTLQRRDPENELSPRYVDMDGQNLAVASTGTRLLMTLLGLCMDEEFDTILIDEPELGLSPRLQGVLARFFADKAQRAEYFPHLDRIFVATHSHLMLDKTNFSNNFVVTKEGQHIDVEQIKNVSDLHRLQFNLLGNSLEDLFLPSAIVICEGKTDKPFIERLLELRHPDKRILVIEGQGDVKRIFRNLTQSLGDMRKSPFRDRTYIILDSVHTKGTVQGLESLGAQPANIIVWDRNGIEYVYPPSLLREAFSCDEAALADLSTNADNVVVGRESIRKVVLGAEVIAKMRADTLQADELERKFLQPMANTIG